jgi:hypothetical protein
MGSLVLIAVIVVISYLVSLRLHPRGSICSKCKGTGMHRGLFFTYANRACTKCGGTPLRARAGVRVIHRNKQVWGERKPQDAAKKRNFGR